ncbi:MAG: hypothetical protein OXH09_01200, partial [Gammaproteobacteria bacterium]|nr:hypothetical protein [Gammaproteobacteria bacterium]
MCPGEHRAASLDAARWARHPGGRRRWVRASGGTRANAGSPPRSPPSPEVYLTESEEEDRPRPAPVDLDDPQAFYALFHGHSMVPAGIGPADFCLVSPCAKLEPGQRIWLRDREGREGLRWLIRLTATTYEVAAWQPPKPNGHQDL